MSIVKSRCSVVPTLAAAGWLVLASTASLSAQNTLLFADDFEQDSSANWTILAGATDGVPDYQVDFHYVYTTNTYTFNGENRTIPPAPGSAAGPVARGVRVTVNKNDDAPEAAGVNLYPEGKTFSGNYALSFDLWLNYAGDAYGAGASGTTEFALFGLNASGTLTNWPTTGSLTNSSDGAWFAVDGEGGSSRDYRAYLGDLSGDPIELDGFSAGFVDGDGNGTPEVNVVRDPDDQSDKPLEAKFPETEYETPGAIGKHWVHVEISQRDGTLTWKINGNVMAERVNDQAASPSGNILLGYADILNSIANPTNLNYALFDNVRVEQLQGTVAPEPTNLKITANDDGSLLITFTAGGEMAQYHLQARPDFDAAHDWQDEPATMTSPASGQFQITLPPPAEGMRFFRIRT